ncbi:MAG: S1/P1 nuclease [Planctomycetes bacterium]|nr:S1/P1 nuclease [Planctomycetota bacterium]
MIHYKSSRWPVYMVAVALVLLAMPRVSVGWGAAGHRIVGRIASERLSPEARKEVDRLLKLDTEYSSLEDCCIWADAIRRDSKWRWAARLHYLNIPKKTDTYKASRDCKPKTDCPANTPCPPRNCVVSGITYYLEVLGDREASDHDRLIALKFVGHFVGDIHQPLHAGYARDRGGNDVRVEFFRNNTNLHRVWDSGMIRRMGRWSDLATELSAQTKAPDAKKKVAKWANDLDAVSWAEESHALTEKLYEGIPKSGIISDAYLSQQTPLLKTQLQKAGVRLAGVLNQAFKE